MQPTHNAGMRKLVVERTRRGRSRPEKTCTCRAVRYPHRVGTVPGCYGDLVCYHGMPMYGHPDWDERCPDCDREAAADIAFDCWRDARLI